MSAEQIMLVSWTFAPMQAPMRLLPLHVRSPLQVPLNPASSQQHVVAG